MDYLIQNELVKDLTVHLKQNEIGIIYLDIIKFTEIEKKHGLKKAGDILQLLEHAFILLKERHPEIFYIHRIVGDDFFIYVKLDKKSNMNETLKDILKKINGFLNEQITYYYSHTGISIKFHQSCTILLTEGITTLERAVYITIKYLLRQAKLNSLELENEQLKEAFQDLILHNRIQTHFQPIVSLTSSETYGFEALSRGQKNTYFAQPLNLFSYAENEGLLYVLEKTCRELALHRSKLFLLPKQKVFINVSAPVIFDPAFQPETMRDFVEACGLSNENIVFEITERTAIHDFTVVKKALDQFKKKGFEIAIDDAGAGYSSLQAISELRPHYIKVDRSLVQDIHINFVKKNMMETFVSFAKRMNSKVIAEGIENSAELKMVVELGVDYGQGFYLAKPSFPPKKINEEAGSMILLNKGRRDIRKRNELTISSLAQPFRAFSPNELVKSVSSFLDSVTGEAGAVITENNIPVGLVMRDKLNRQLAKPYGMSLFWDKPVCKLMDKEFLVVLKDESVEEVAQKAVTRNAEQMYDYIIVNDDKGYVGTVSIQMILDHLTSVNNEKLKDASPLTGMPGNKEIKKQLTNKLQAGKPFMLIYADLDEFKKFNDSYGFSLGDELIKKVGVILEEVMYSQGTSSDFSGHIGGDDFIMISMNHRSNQICEMILKEFDRMLLQFIAEISIKLELEKMPFIPSLSLVLLHVRDCSLSMTKLSAIAAEQKAVAKKIKGSCYIEYILKKEGQLV